MPLAPSTLRPTRTAPSAPAPAVSPYSQRPRYREPHPVTATGVLSGAVVAVLWFVITMLLGVDLRSTLWVMIVSGTLASAVSFLLARYGDRGVATGITAVAGTAFTVVGLVVEWQLLNGTWILW